MRLDAIRALPTHEERAREAQRLAAYCREMLTAAIQVRDASLRGMRADGITRPEIARRTGVGEPTVKVVTR